MADLADLSQYKEYKHVKSDTNDIRLETILPAVSDFVKDFCGRTFIDYIGDFKDEYFDGTYETKLYPRECPIIEVERLEISLDGWLSSRILVPQRDYFISPRKGNIISGSNRPFICSNLVGIQEDSLKLVYKGGYEKLPNDMLLAVLDLAEYWLSEDYTPRKQLAGNFVENIGFRQAGTGIPGHVHRTLSLYRWLD